MEIRTAEAELEAGIEELMAEEINPGPRWTGLAGVVWAQWQTNERHRREEIDDELLAAHHMRAARYSDEKRAEIVASGGEDVYAPLASMQSVSGAAAVRQVVVPSGDRAWSLKPSPIPELPTKNRKLVDEQLKAELLTNPGMGAQREAQLVKAQSDKVNAEAKAAAVKMNRKIHDQLIESGFYSAVSTFIEDFATYPYAVMKRVASEIPAIEWKNGKIVKTKKIKDVDARVSPFDIYPSPGMIGVNDGPLIERMRLLPNELAAYRNLPGYQTDAIESVIDNCGGMGGWLFNWGDSQRDDAEQNSDMAYDSSYIDVLRYWGQVSGKDLKLYGVADIDDYEYRDCEVWLAGTEVIKVALNSHPLDHRPYYKAVWREVPGQFWGNTPITQVTHLQNICNAAMRALVKNMGVAAGPQVVVDIAALPRGENEVTSIYPLKIWQVATKPGQSSQPVTFFQPSSNARELIDVFRHYWELAGDVTGIYRYNYGADAGMQGAAQTMNGLSMLLENSSKVIRHAVENLENGVMIPRVRDQFYINMMYSPDSDVKGDVEVEVRGSSALIQKAAVRQRRNELLSLMNNIPETQQLGPLYSKIRLAILSDTAKDLDITDDRFPTAEEIDQLLQAAQQAQQQQPKDPRVEAAKISASARIEDQKLEMQDRIEHRKHQLMIKKMELDGMQQQSDKAAQRNFEAKKMEVAEAMQKLTQEKAKVEAELGLKAQGRTGI